MPIAADFALPADAFGDPYDLANLPLPRPADGYAVQMLDTDKLLDRASGEFLSVREAGLQALHISFAAAFSAASDWRQRHGEAPLAIVPVAYDDQMRRHVLIYGVLPESPKPRRSY